MSNIIDRRLNPRDKTIKNRQKFIKRSREQIKEAVKEAIKEGNVADIENERVRVRTKGISEPTFRPDPKTGDKRYVMPGNKEFVAGDTQDKPPDEEGGGGGQGDPSDSGEGEDDFEFYLNRDEYIDFLFEDLELPDLVKKQVKDLTKVSMHRAGYTNTGNPSQLDIVRTMKNSMGRRIGLKRPKNEELEELYEQLALAQERKDNVEESRIQGLIDELEKRRIAIPWMDPFDVRYRAFTPRPEPMTQAVMFCIMDVSASMGEMEKDLAKRFFLFLHMFLQRKYEKVEIIFIRHHVEAKEVDEDEFFHSKESGGTIVSSALTLAKEIVNKRYNVADWNIYVAQASDGDNFPQDQVAAKSAVEDLLEISQYFAYVELNPLDKVPYFYGYQKSMTDLWKTYYHLAKENDHMNMRKVNTVKDVWKVFRELFTKEEA